MTQLADRSAEPSPRAFRLSVHAEGSTKSQAEGRSQRSPVRRKARLGVAAGVFGLCLAVYILTLAPGVLGGDSGELQYIPYILGVAHPTGYPLYTLLGWLWTHLVIVGNVAYRMNLFSALAGALTVGVLYLIIYHLTAQHVPAVVAALFLAFSPTFWFEAIIAEVYTLNLLFMALCLLLLLRWQEGKTKLELLAFTYGLSLTHHRHIILLLPAFIYFIHAVKRGALTDWRLMSRSVLSFLLPQLLHLYIPIRIWQLFPPEYYDQIPNTLVGMSFAGFFHWPKASTLLLPFTLAFQQFGWGLFWGMWGLLTSFLSLPRPRPLALMLAVAYFCHAGFAIFYRVWEREPFFLPLFFLTALWIGIGAWALQRAVPSRARPFTGIALVLLTGAWSLWNGYFRPVLQDTAVRDIPPLSHSVARTAEEMFSYPYEKEATVLVDWGMAYALQYCQAAEGVRPDLEIMPISLSRRQDYVLLKEILAGRRPRYIYNLSPVVRYPVTTHRPLYVLRQPLSVSTRTQAEISLVKEAEGVVRVVPDDPIPSHRLDRHIGSGAVLRGYEVRGEELHLYWQTSQSLDQDYGTFVRFFDNKGELIGQQDKPADDLEVMHMTTSEWEVGQTVRDVFVLPEGTVRIEVGMHCLEGEGIVPYGETISVELDL